MTYYSVIRYAVENNKSVPQDYVKTLGYGGFVSAEYTTERMDAYIFDSEIDAQMWIDFLGIKT